MYELNSKLPNYLPLSGGQMTGELKTSMGGVVPCTRQATSTTVTDLINEVRYTNGCMGSVSLSESYTYGSYTISSGWWIYLYIPHRTGGSTGDNCNYGCLILIGMTVSQGSMYTISISSGAIANVLSH